MWLHQLLKQIGHLLLLVVVVLYVSLVRQFVPVHPLEHWHSLLLAVLQVPGKQSLRE